MFIIVDGYNILKQVINAGHVTQKQRDQFIMLLRYYAKMKHNKIIVVFDGGSFDEYEKKNDDTVTVIYAGVNETADEHIKNLMVKYKNRDVLLVTTDRELNRYAARLAIPSMDSYDFYTVMRAHMSKKKKNVNHENALIKIAESNNADIDTLMHEASKIVPQKVVDQQSYELPEKKKLNKEEKKLWQKLKKL